MKYTLQEIRNGTGFPNGVMFEAINPPQMERTLVDYADSLPLVDALWYFIENVSEDHTERTALFFRLRERMRDGK